LEDIQLLVIALFGKKVFGAVVKVKIKIGDKWDYLYHYFF